MTTKTLPDNLIFSDLELTQYTPSFANESISLIRTTKSRGLHRFDGTLDVTIDDLETQRAYIGFIADVAGQANEFELDLPSHFKSSDVTFNPTTSADVGIGSNEIPLNAFIGTIYKGTMVNFLNDSKVHVVLEDCESGDNLKIFPSLRQAQTINSPVEVKDPKLLVAFTSDKQTLSFSNQGEIVTHTMTWSEVL